MTLDTLAAALGVRPPDRAEMEPHSNRKRIGNEGEFNCGDAHPNSAATAETLCTDPNCTDLDCTSCLVYFNALTEGLGMQPIQPQIKRARSNINDPYVHIFPEPHSEVTVGQGASAVDYGLISHAELQSEATVVYTSEDLDGLADQFELGPQRPNTQADQVVQ